MDTAQERIARKKWYHAFELKPGLVTPGMVPLNAGAIFDMLGVEKDLIGKRALDVGCWDGPMAFEFERRGAAVDAVDLHHPDISGFNLAKDILNSNVNYVRGSVYDIEEIFGKSYDYVSFFGVYYHLKHPLLAFETLRRVLNPGGRVLVEGECLCSYAEDLEGVADESEALRAFAKSNLPLTLVCPGKFKGQSNWHIPNLACIRSWIESAGMVLEQQYITEDASSQPYAYQRFSGVARAALRAQSEEHPYARERDADCPVFSPAKRPSAL